MDPIISASGAVSAIIPEVWSARYTERFNDLLVFPGLIRRDYEGEITSLGDTVHIPSLPDVSAQNLIEGAKGDTTAITATKTSLIVNRRSYVDFEITDQAELQSIPFMDQLREIAINAIMRKMQDDLISDIAPSTAAPDHTLAYDNGTTLADADLLEALDLERVANWPESDKFLITGAQQYNDLLNIQKFYDKTINDGNAVVNNGQMLAPVYGHKVGWTTAMGTRTLLFHLSFMQAAVQRGLGLSLHDLGGQGKRSFRLNVDLLWGAKQIHSDRVISIG